MPTDPSRQNCIIIPGTWAEADDADLAYWEVGGSFVTFLDVSGYNVFYPGRRWWTGNLEGGPFERLVYRRWAQNAWHRDWRQGGENITHGLQGLVASEKLVAFVHSHGLQPLLYALSRTDCPPIQALCSIGSPVRADMAEIAEKARPKILGKWVHIADGSFFSDFWKVMGTIGTGSFWDTFGAASGMSDGPKLADQRIRLEGVKHTGLLDNTDHYHHWLELGILETLRETT